MANLKRIFGHKSFRPAVGAGATILCGLLLWGSPIGKGWVGRSYDYLFRFGSHEVTNKVVVILMDDASRRELGQASGREWDRGLHAKLLNRLADDGSSLVVMDVKFLTNGTPASDVTLARAMKRQRHIVLAAMQERLEHSGLEGRQLVLPCRRFLNAAGSNNWGVAWLTPDVSSDIVRQHWPFPSPGEDPSLPWTAAILAGAHLPDTPQERWLRYYGEAGAWTRLDYRSAMREPEGYFRNKIVFVGHTPVTPSIVDREEDEFCTPYTRWTGETRGGVEILATQFLNLVNGDWLKRPPWPAELFLLLLSGIVFGAGLGFLRPWFGAVVVVAAGLAVTLGAVWFSHLSNIWFPWLVIVGGQLPCAWLCSLPYSGEVKLEAPRGGTQTVPQGDAETVLQGGSETVPHGGVETVEGLYTPDYHRVRKLGVGGFGEVWLVRNAIGQWQALKVVYRKNFEEERHYHYEFEGIEKYKPVSERHQGLLRIELISRKRPEGYYYYVMELGDSLKPGWQDNPALYLPDTLSSRCRYFPQSRIPVLDCARIGVILAKALQCLHQNGLTHRDVKPQNVIFVNSQPKLADVGLVTHTRSPGMTTTQVGTPGYMPPEPEPQGTVQADIYGLGMMLYVISTGKAPNLFPELSRTLLNRSSSADFLRLNPIILKACHPDCRERYESAVELHDALLDLMRHLEQEGEP